MSPVSKGVLPNGTTQIMKPGKRYHPSYQFCLTGNIDPYGFILLGTLALGMGQADTRAPTDDSEDGGPRLRVKAELRHPPRNQDADVTALEEQLVRHLNHVEEQVEEVKINVGRAAGSVFIRLTRGRKNPDYIGRIVREVTSLMERRHYAEDVWSPDWRIEAVSTDE